MSYTWHSTIPSLPSRLSRPQEEDLTSLHLARYTPIWSIRFHMFGSTCFDRSWRRLSCRCLTPWIGNPFLDGEKCGMNSLYFHWLKDIEEVASNLHRHILSSPFDDHSEPDKPSCHICKFWSANSYLELCFLNTAKWIIGIELNFVPKAWVKLGI